MTMTTSGFILLVEDDRDVRESMQEALEDEGYKVIGAVDGVDALERLQSAPPLPDLVLLDLMMPRMSGAELREAMTKVPEWNAIPIIVLSADSNLRAKAETLRVAGYLQKPVKLSKLFDTIAETIVSPS